MLLFGVSADSPPGRAGRSARRSPGRAAAVALLVMGDGSARRSVKGPGFLDERAGPFDAEVSRALAAGDVAAPRGPRPRPVRGPAGRGPRVRGRCWPAPPQPGPWRRRGDATTPRPTAWATWSPTGDPAEPRRRAQRGARRAVGDVVVAAVELVQGVLRLRRSLGDLVVVLAARLLARRCQRPCRCPSRSCRRAGRRPSRPSCLILSKMPMHPTVGDRTADASRWRAGGDFRS